LFKPISARHPRMSDPQQPPQAGTVAVGGVDPGL
jgi:hypothetical protein